MTTPLSAKVESLPSEEEACGWKLECNIQGFALEGLGFESSAAHAQVLEPPWSIFALVYLCFLLLSNPWGLSFDICIA